MRREEFMKRIDAKITSKKDRVNYDPASYAFGAEEMLLNEELKQLEADKEQDLEK